MSKLYLKESAYIDLSKYTQSNRSYDIIKFSIISADVKTRDGNIYHLDKSEYNKSKIRKWLDDCNIKSILEFRADIVSDRYGYSANFLSDVDFYGNVVYDMVVIENGINITLGDVFFTHSGGNEYIEDKDDLFYKKERVEYVTVTYKMYVNDIEVTDEDMRIIYIKLKHSKPIKHLVSR